MSEKLAVVMGDLVSSESSKDVSATHRRFNLAVDQANAAYPRLVSPLTITLGDEFQGLASQLSSAINVVRYMRFDLLDAGIDCRFVVGQVRIETPVNRDKAWNMMGPGLSRAREMLGRKRDTSLYLFSLPNHHLLEHNLNAIGAGLTTIERRWTDRQREDVLASLGGATAEEIARKRNVAVHSVYKVRAAGQFDAYSVQWAAIDNTLATLDMELRG
jgi:hypothetical protein